MTGYFCSATTARGGVSEESIRRFDSIRSGARTRPSCLQNHAGWSRVCPLHATPLPVRQAQPVGVSRCPSRDEAGVLDVRTSHGLT